MKENLAKWYKLFLTIADIAHEYIRRYSYKIQQIEWKSYFHPTVYTTEGIERMASIGLDLFIAFGISLFPLGGWLIGITYILLRDALPFLEGQSLGKHFFGLRAVSKQTLRPLTHNYKKAFIRSAVILIPGLNIFDLYNYLTKGERIADQWANTMVVSERYHISSDKGSTK